MKFTGISLIVVGVMLSLLGCAQYFQSAPPVGEPAGAYSLNPMFTFVIATGSITAGVLIALFGGRGYSSRHPAAQPPAVSPPAD